MINASLVPRPFVEEMAWQLTRVQTVYGYDIKEITVAPARASNEFWIMHVIFDRNYVTARNVQEHCQQDSLQAYIGQLLYYLSSVDILLAVDSVSLAHQCRYAQLKVSTNTASHCYMYSQTRSLFCPHKSAEGVLPSFQVLAVY